MQIGADVKPVYFFIWGKSKEGVKIHRLGAVNKGRWEGGGNDKRVPLETVPGDWRPTMHRRRGRGGGAGETIKRRRERGREKATFWTPAVADPQSVQIVAAIRDREWFPTSFTVANRCGAGVWILVRVFSFSCFVSRVCMGSRRARSWRTDVQGVNMKMAVLMFRLDHVRGYGWLCFGLPTVEFSQSVLVCSLKPWQLPCTLDGAACVEPAAEASS
jgi:hypothetical protein